MLAVKRSAGVAPDGDLGFETERRCHQKSKTGIPVSPK